MTCKGTMCTDKHLGIDTDQIIGMCKSIIKVCKEEPHAVDSYLEEAYISLSAVGLLLKQSRDRAKAEREKFEKSQTTIKTQRKRIPGLAKIIPTNLTTPAIHKMLENMNEEQIEALMTKVHARRS